MTNEELSLKTKQTLAKALKQIMEKKSLSKITINELTSACHLNRNTFYYYFQDIYDLLKWFLEQEAIEVIKKFDLIQDTEEAFRFIMRYIEDNKSIINCAYDSMGYEQLRFFLYKDLFDVMHKTINEGEKAMNISVNEEFKDFMTEFYTAAIASTIIDWIKNRSTKDRETAIQNMLMICQVSIPQVLLAKAQQHEKL